MIRALTGILALLVLYLAARNTRLEDRQRILEEKLAAAEARQRGLKNQVPPSTPAASDREPELRATPAPAAASLFPAVPKDSTPEKADVFNRVLKVAQTFVTDRVTEIWTPQQGSVKRVAVQAVLSQSDENLGLSPTQKQAIDQLRAIRDARTQSYHDEIGKIESETEDSIRKVLTADQLAKYDGQNNGTATFQLVQQESEPSLPAGVNPGYLGVSGEDAKGGGVRLSQVMDGTAAAGAGLRQGDVILDINGEPLTNYVNLASRIRTIGEGTPVVLRILRDGSEFTQGLQLGPRPK